MEAGKEEGQVVAFDLGIKTLATGVNEQGRVYTIGASRGQSGTTNNSTRSAPSERSARRSHGGLSV
jgi:transposase